MKILFVIPSYKPAYGYGGTTIAVSELAETLSAHGHSVTVYTTSANGKDELPVEVGKKTIISGVEVYYFKRITGDHTHVSPQLWNRLWTTCRNFEIVHLHSWWSLLIIGAAQICQIRKVNFILSPHGMLGNYTFTNQHGVFKKVIHFTVGKRLLKKSILHATTPMEWRECLQVYPNWKGFVLFNLVLFPATAAIRAENSVFTIGFLSRIDPKKGLDKVLTALSGVNFKYNFKVAGSGDDKYVNYLKDLAERLNISKNIEWSGWKAGDEKFRFLESIDLFVLNSVNENFAIAVIESLAVGTPVLISENVGLADYVKMKKLGWISRNDTQSMLNEFKAIYAGNGDLSLIKSRSPGVIKSDFDKNSLALKYELEYANYLNRQFPA